MYRTHIHTHYMTRCILYINIIVKCGNKQQTESRDISQKWLSTVGDYHVSSETTDVVRISGSGNG